MATPSGTGGSLPPPRRRLSKSAEIGLGLLFAFAGLFLLSILLPTASGAFPTALPAAMAGMLSLFVGGVLMGRGSRGRPR